ncbi:MAG: hypothetical protein ACXWFQ_04280, partial [Thermoanaerobaculia bacterium]
PAALLALVAAVALGACAKKDPEGRLREFVAVPPQVLPSAAEPPATPVWDVLLAEAGLDPKTFTRSDPAWLPSVPFDAIAGFTGPMPGEKDVTLRVVAAAFRGRPASFQLVAPWSVPHRDAAMPVTLRSRIRGATFSLTTLIIAGAAVWFARRNTRLGRGDRRGAARVGTTVSVCMFLLALLLSHPAAIWNQGFARPLVLRCGGLGILAWGIYLAFEPYFRRRYPELLVSWTRLVGGRWAILSSAVISSVASSSVAARSSSSRPSPRLPQSSPQGERLPSPSNQKR